MLRSLSEMLQDFPENRPAAEQVDWLRTRLTEFHAEVVDRVATLEKRQEDVERRVAEHEAQLGEHSRRLDHLEQQVAAARRGEVDVALLDGLDPELSTRH